MTTIRLLKATWGCWVSSKPAAFKPNPYTALSPTPEAPPNASRLWLTPSRLDFGVSFRGFGMPEAVPRTIT